MQRCRRTTIIHTIQQACEENQFCDAKHIYTAFSSGTAPPGIKATACALCLSALSQYLLAARGAGGGPSARAGGGAHRGEAGGGRREVDFALIVPGRLQGGSVGRSGPTRSALRGRVGRSGPGSVGSGRTDWSQPSRCRSRLVAAESGRASDSRWHCMICLLYTSPSPRD